MIEYSLSNVHMEGGIRGIFCTCFRGCEAEYDLFFEQMYSEKRAVVGALNGNPVCALHLIDAEMIQETGTIPGYYIYGAATLAEYRKNGYMRGLILYAEKLATLRGKKFLSLVPANDELYEFYEKLGFCRFFKHKKISLTHADVKALPSMRQSGDAMFKTADVREVREQIFNGVGDVKWPQKHIEFNIKLNKLYGGETIFAKRGYAVCKKREGTTEISELCAFEADVPDIIKQILGKYKSENYVFTVPADNNVLKQDGKSDFSGMIKPLAGHNISGFSAYLGLGMN